MKKFAEHVEAQSREIVSGTASKGNRHANAYIRAFRRLCERYGDAGRDELAKLLSDDRRDVRQMAAVFLLRYRHAESVKVLEDLSKGVGMIAFGAQEALKRWDEGAWKLDPDSIDEKPAARLK